MIVVAGLLVVKPEDMPKVREAALAVMAATEKEAGCIHYRFSEDLGRPGHLRVYEEWESDAHLAEHVKAPHVATWHAALRQLTVISRKVEVFSGFTTRPI